jgi:DNA invertase Pin-like site-specific DNA recombinase
MSAGSLLDHLVRPREHGRAGAVISLEVSRLARNNRDWHQLLELCGLTNTIIVDAEGIYDPL